MTTKHEELRKLAESAAKCRNNAGERFKKAANPQTIITLLDEIEALQAQREALIAIGRQSTAEIEMLKEKLFWAEKAAKTVKGSALRSDAMESK